MSIVVQSKFEISLIILRPNKLDGWNFLSEFNGYYDTIAWPINFNFVTPSKQQADG